LTGAGIFRKFLAGNRGSVRQVKRTENLYYRAFGSAEALMGKAEEIGQVWMKGVASEVPTKILPHGQPGHGRSQA
jgi:hypothetical protein